MIKKLLEDRTTLGRGRLDKDAGIVRNVKILGFRSHHGYDYSPKALQEAVSMYEGVHVNLDHPNRSDLGASRRYEDRFGRLKNVSFQEARGLVGDLHYNKKHRIAEQFEYDVEHDPTMVGLSHNASGAMAKGRRGDRPIVESINVLRSVDLVADPATNVGLFESKRAARYKKRKKQEEENNKELIEADADETSDKSSKQSIGELLFNTYMNEADPKKAREKVNKILDMSAEITEPLGDGEEVDEEDDLPDAKSPKGKDMKKTAKKKESALTESRIAEIVSRVIDSKEKPKAHEQRVKDLCEDMGLKPTRVQMKALVALTKKSEVKELVESMLEDKPNKISKKPKSKAGEGSRSKQVSSREFLEAMDLDPDEGDEEDIDGDDDE